MVIHLLEIGGNRRGFSGDEVVVPQPGTGADDGTGLGGGSSVWH